MHAPLQTSSAPAARDLARELIRQRYRRGDAPQPRQWNETLDVLLGPRLPA